jgi:hypothetical protein
MRQVVGPVHQPQPLSRRPAQGAMSWMARNQAAIYLVAFEETRAKFVHQAAARTFDRRRTVARPG